MRRALLIATALGMLALAASPAARAAGPPLLDRPGFWDLGRLGPRELALPTNERSRSVREFALPEGARQGPDRWYRLRLHVRLTFAPGSRSGNVYVTGSTNGRAADMVKVKVQAGNARRPRLAWSTLDLLQGAATGVEHGRELTLLSENYVQDRGVRPGRNTLAFELETLGDVKLAAVTILPDSGLRVTPEKPARIVLEPRLPAGIAYAGETITVPYVVRNVGDVPAHRVTVEAMGSSRALQTTGARIVDSLGGGERLEGEIRVRPARPGSYRLELSAGASNTNRPLVEIAVPARTRPAAPQTTGGGVALPAGAGGLLALGLVVTLRNRRRRVVH